MKHEWSDNLFICLFTFSSSIFLCSLFLFYSVKIISTPNPVRTIKNPTHLVLASNCKTVQSADRDVNDALSAQRLHYSRTAYVNIAAVTKTEVIPFTPRPDLSNWNKQSQIKLQILSDDQLSSWYSINSPLHLLSRQDWTGRRIRPALHLTCLAARCS